MEIKRTSVGAKRNPESRDAIIAAASQVLADKGYAGFTIEEIAKTAGAGKATIYRWWPTRAALFIDVYGSTKAATFVATSSGNLPHDLKHYTVELWKFWASNPAGPALRGLIAEGQTSDDALKALREDFLPFRTEAVRSLFVRAAALGDMSLESVDARVSAWVGFIWLRLLTAQLEPDPELDHLIGLICTSRT